MTLCGPGEVGVTGREVGHVGGVIQVKEATHLKAGRTPRFCSAQDGQPQPTCLLRAAQSRCPRVCARARTTEGS